MRLSSHGFEVELPARWEGAVVDPAPVEPPHRRSFGTRSSVPVSERPALHLATIPLPPRRGDFGSGVVADLGARDAFVALVEFDPASARTALFAREGMPRALRPTDLHPRALQRTILGQAGHQTFFSEAGRALCLYVVIGDRDRAAATLPDVNDVLTRIHVRPTP